MASPTSPALLNNFRELTTSVSALCLRGEIGIRAWKEAGVPYFAALEPHHQDELIRSFTVQLEIYERFLGAQRPLLDSWGILNEFLPRLNFDPAPDLHGFVGPNDYLAVYDLGARILLLGPNHFQHMSYTLEDLYCRNWMELLRRDEKIEKLLFERLFAFIQGKRTHTISNEDIPPHIIVETQSSGRHSVTVESKAYSPLFRDGKPAGVLVINHGVRPASRFLPKPPASLDA
jgi:hypothetical protein